MLSHGRWRVDGMEFIGMKVHNDAWSMFCRSPFVFKPININIIYDKHSNSKTIVQERCGTTAVKL